MDWQDFLARLDTTVEETDKVKRRECCCSEDDYLVSTGNDARSSLSPVGKCKEDCIVANIINCKIKVIRASKSTSTRCKGRSSTFLSFS
ncbi:MAG: hypothetical protein ACXAEU_10410 [Candidatus Hodarchaeales archaeon]